MVLGTPLTAFCVDNFGALIDGFSRRDAATTTSARQVLALAWWLPPHATDPDPDPQLTEQPAAHPPGSWSSRSRTRSAPSACRAAWPPRHAAWRFHRGPLPSSGLPPVAP